jgi:hypothetical protein
VKVCRTCKAEKPMRAFYRRAESVDGHTSECKECKKAYTRERHWLKRDQINAKKRVYNALPAYREARRRYSKSPRGRTLKRESARFRRRIRRMEAAA